MNEDHSYHAHVLDDQDDRRLLDQMDFERQCDQVDTEIAAFKTILRNLARGAEGDEEGAPVVNNPIDVYGEYVQAMAEVYWGSKELADYAMSQLGIDGKDQLYLAKDC